MQSDWELALASTPPAPPNHMESGRARYLSGPITAMSKKVKSQGNLWGSFKGHIWKGQLWWGLCLSQGVRIKREEEGWVTAALICKVRIRGDRSSARKRQKHAVLTNITGDKPYSRFNAGKFEVNDELKAADEILNNILWDVCAWG